MLLMRFFDGVCIRLYLNSLAALWRLIYWDPLLLHCCHISFIPNSSDISFITVTSGPADFIHCRLLSSIIMEPLLNSFTVSIIALLFYYVRSLLRYYTAWWRACFLTCNFLRMPTTSVLRELSISLRHSSLLALISFIFV